MPADLHRMAYAHRLICWFFCCYLNLKCVPLMCRYLMALVHVRLELVQLNVCPNDDAAVAVAFVVAVASFDSFVQD